MLFHVTEPMYGLIRWLSLVLSSFKNHQPHFMSQLTSGIILLESEYPFGFHRRDSPDLHVLHCVNLQVTIVMSTNLVVSFENIWGGGRTNKVYSKSSKIILKVAEKSRLQFAVPRGLLDARAWGQFKIWMQKKRDIVFFHNIFNIPIHELLFL